MWNDDKFIAFDFETSGELPEYALQPWRVKTKKAWATSLAWVYGDPDDVPTIRGGLNPSVDDMREMLEFAIENDMTLVGWNTAFDIGWLIAYGLGDLCMKAKWLDAMLLWKHLTIEPEYDEVGARRKSYSLKAAVPEFIPDEAGYEEDIDFHDASPEAREKLHSYNVKDTMFTLMLAKRFYNELPEKQLNVALIEAECLPMVALANVEGMQVDLEKAHELVAHLDAVAAQKLEELAPHGVTEAIVRSPKQLAELLFDTWELTSLGNTASGARSTDKAVLHELSLIDPRVKAIREYKEALNNKTKFAESLIESATYNEDGTTHPEARVFGTYSGRLTYSSNQGRGKGLRQTGFAIHQMKRGKEFRSLIKAPEGFTLLEFDAAGQEFRWMALASKDPVMLDLCMPGKDPHAYMASRIEEGAERQLGKVANLSLQYRTSAKKLMQVARVQYGMAMELPEAEKIHAAYQQAYECVPQYWAKQEKKGRVREYAQTFAGRRVTVKGNWSADAWRMASTMINYPIQGTGADQKYLAMKMLKPILIEMGGRFLFDLHDGIYTLIPDAKLKEAATRIRDTLDNLPYADAWGFTPSIPLIWDCKAGKSWGELKEYAFEAGEERETNPAPLSQQASPHSGDRDRGAKAGLTVTNMVSEPVDQVRTTNVVKVDFIKEARERALETALTLAKAGIKVFPCKSNKHPVDGFNDWDGNASCDRETIIRWFTKDYVNEASMVGLPCGANNLLVLDPDVPKPEKGKYIDGLALFNELIADLGIDLTGVPVVISPSGGKHFFFSQPIDGSQRFGCSPGDLPKAIDVKGDGGYVIAVGSRWDDGRGYEADPAHPSFLSLFANNKLPQLPQQLADLLKTKSERTGNAERMSREHIEQALKLIPNDAYFADRNDWIAMGFAVFGASGGEDWGRDLWIDWSAKWRGETKEGSAEKFWDTVRPATVSAGAGYIRMQLDRIEEHEFAQATKAFGMFDDDPDDEIIEEVRKAKEKSDARANTYADAAFMSGQGKRQREPYLVKGLITARGLTYIAGQPSAGKSAIAVRLAVALATGSSFAGRKVREKMAVIYVAAEAPGTIQDRLDVADLKEQSSTYPIAVMPLVPNLADKKARHDFIGGVKIVAQRLEEQSGLKVGAVFIDTLARAFEIQDENAAGEMGGVVRAIDEIRHAIDAAGIVVHHMGKDANAGMRGSNTQNAAADDEIHITGDTSSTHNERQMRHAKSRSFETGSTWWFDLKVIEVDEDEDGDPITAVRAEFKASPTKRVRETGDDVRARIMEAIKNEPTATVGEIATAIAKVRSTTSDHIQVMKQLEHIKHDKGRWTVLTEGEKWLKTTKRP
jgi:DNA polymerase I-like protein with 3'-5' exonuclease and polymerase domains